MGLPGRFTTVATLGLLLIGCASAPADTWVELQGSRYQVEIAATGKAREKGLMNRDVLPAGHGMLFIHDQQEPQAYWMKNTRIPLDILYFDAERRLVSQKRNAPPCDAGDRCPPYPSTSDARFVLELNAGQAARLGLHNGATIEFSPSIAVR